MPDLFTALQVAKRFRVPEAWVKTQARAGVLPCLKVGKRFLFSLAAVSESLAALAASPTVSHGSTAQPAGGSGAN